MKFDAKVLSRTPYEVSIAAVKAASTLASEAAKEKLRMERRNLEEVHETFQACMKSWRSRRRPPPMLRHDDATSTSRFEAAMVIKSNISKLPTPRPCITTHTGLLSCSDTAPFVSKYCFLPPGGRTEAAATGTLIKNPFFVRQVMTIIIKGVAC